jgi:hypothetical protein
MRNANKALSDPRVVDDILNYLTGSMHDVELNSQKENRLFIICPTDAIETYIHKHFKGNNYIFPILGLSLDLEDYYLQRQLQSMVSIYDITAIYLIQRNDNPIIKNIFLKKKRPSTNAEIQLEELLISNYLTLKKEKNSLTQVERLCQLQIERQQHALEAFIAQQNHSKISLRGFQFDLKKHLFTELDIMYK